MRRSRLKDVVLVPRSQSTWLCVLFVVIFYYRRDKAKHPERESRKEIDAQTCVTAQKFDADYPKFAKSSQTFSGECRALISILVPSYRSKILRYLVLHMGLLGLRTYLSLVVADLDGKIVRHLIGLNGPAFASGLIEWLVLAVPASYTNGMIRYLEGKISLEFRKSLIRYVHDLYIASNQEYYKANSIDGALDGIDHFITSDITKFSSSVAKLYANFGKPALDMFVFSRQLAKNLGGKTLLVIFINYMMTALSLRYVAPSFGKLAARSTKLEGHYRNAHSRVIQNSEEIAFYNGARIEKRNLKSLFGDLLSQLRSALRIECMYSIVEGYVLKYSWSASGYLFASIPVYLPRMVASGESARGNIGNFITNKRIMMSMSDAGGRMMYSIKDLAELAGYMRRVYRLMAMLHRVRKQAYGGRAPKGEYTLASVFGKLEMTATDAVRFENVPIVVPGLGYDLSEGELLLNPLTFEVTSGKSLLIIGSNGTGKSSIARLAAGMWPVYRGLLQRSKSVSFLPQRPYFFSGTLRDQITYPEVGAFVSDATLLRLLERVHLAYLPEREGGFDAVAEWKDVFSGGEKQRILFARILYSNPKFAVIDEGTSAVSADMEGLLYEECKSQGITLLTISHRISLLKYHNAKLEVGLGDDKLEWSLDDTSSSRGWPGLDNEIAHIRGILDKVPELTARREEVIRLLQE